MTGWVEVSCGVSDVIRGNRHVTVLAGRTDMDEDRESYREWGLEGGVAVLREWMWFDDRTPGCLHEVPAQEER